MLKNGFDNQKAYKEIVNKLKKYTQYVQDAGAETARIKEIMEDLPFQVQLILVTKYKKKMVTFTQNPIESLLKECDEKATRAREEISRRRNETNIKFIGQCRLKVNGNITTNSVQEAI